MLSGCQVIPMDHDLSPTPKEYTTAMFRRWFQASLLAGHKDLDLVVAQYFRLAARRRVGKLKSKPIILTSAVKRRQSAERSLTNAETDLSIARALQFLLDQRSMKHKLKLDYSNASSFRLERLLS